MKIYDLGGDEERFDYKAIKIVREDYIDGFGTIFLRVWIDHFNKVKMVHVKPEEVPQSLKDKYHIETGERY